MRIHSRILPLSAVLLAALVSSCDSPTRPPTEGSIRPVITMVRDTTGLYRLSENFTSVTATITSGSFSDVIDFNPVGDNWRGEITGLNPGTYAVTLLGFVGDSVQHYGRTTGINVVAGPPTPTAVTFNPLAPELANPPSATTTNFGATITFPAAIPDATAYVVQASQSPTFATAIVPAQSTTTTVNLFLNATGTWYYRARPQIPGVANVRFSDPQSFQIVTATGGRSPATANTTSLTVGTPGAVVNRNLTTAEPDDWFTLAGLRAGDTLTLDAVAQNLAIPSPLNTILTLYQQDQTTVVATNNDAVGTDARIKVALPADEDYYAQVTAANSTVGHFEFRYLVRRIPAAPTGFTAIAGSNTSVNLAWADNASVANGDQEVGYEIFRCVGAGCSTFTLLTTTAADAVGYTDNGLTTGESYTYRIRARQDADHFSPGFVGPLTVALVGPNAPSDFTATTVSGTQIDLAWTDNSDNEASFQIVHCVGAGCTNYTDLVTLPANTTSYQHTVGLDETHVYQILAVNAVLGSAVVGPVTANTVRPAAPSGLTATTLGATSIQLDWTDNATNPDNETGFRIERCNTAGCNGGFTEIATVGANVVTYTDASATFGNDYGYRVRAYNTPGASAYTNVANANTRAPGAPANFVATIFSSTRVDLTWSDTTAAETGFHIERCVNIGCSNFTDLATLAAGTTSHSDNTVTQGNVYGYRIRANGVAGNSSESGPVVAAILLPAAPTGLTATTVSATQVNLAWTSNSVNETSFRIERCTGAGCAFVGELTNVPAGTTDYSDLSVTEGNEYSYRVRALNAVGPSAYTNVATTSTALPAAPTSLTATTINSTQIDLAWSDVAANEDGYRVERCTGLGCSNFTLFTTLAADATSFQNTVVAGEYFAYRIIAFNDAGLSAASNTATASTILPPTPTDLVATTFNASRVDLTWTDVATNELGYVIFRCAGDGCGGPDFASIADVGPDVAAYSDLTVVPEESYTYQIHAYNIIGTSGTSNTSTTNTRVPNQPSDFVAVAVSATQIDLAWSDTLTTEFGFAFYRCTGAGCVDFAWIGNIGANATQYSDLTVQVDQEYRYYIEAFNASGASLATAPVDVNTLLPGMPDGFSVSAQSSTSVAVLWSDLDLRETGYIVERCTGVGCSDFAVIDSLDASESGMIDAGLATSESFTYRLRAYNLFGLSAYAGPLTVSTAVPATPSGLEATTQSSSVIHLTWVDNATDETGYEIEACLGPVCSDFAQIAAIGADQQFYAASALLPDTTYVFRVRAVSLSGPSDYSATASASTNLPANPSALVAQLVDASQVQLLWTDNSAPPTGETGFEIERCEGAGCVAFALVNTTSPNVAGSTDPVVLGTTYRYRVRAINAVGASGYSNEVQVTVAAPNAPLALSAIGTSPTTIALVWSDDSDNETAIEIERCAGAGCVDFALVSTLSQADATNFADLGLTAESDYRYRVRALNAVGASGYSPIADAHTKLPPAPTGLAAEATSSQVVDLSWTDNATDETSYSVERCEGAACTDFVQIVSLVLNSTSHTDAGLTPNSLYRYRVRAVNSVGGGAYSNIDDAPTDIPVDPSGLTALPMSFTEIELGWVDESNNETGFIIERCQGVGCGAFAVIQLVGADVNSYTDPSALANESYTYRVQAVKTGVGASGYSNSASAVTSVPGDPVNLFASTVTGSRVDLTWDDDATNELAIVIERCAGVGCVDFATLTTLAANTESHSDLTVGLNQTYRYRVRATNNVGTSGYTNEATANTLQPALTSGLSATTVSASQVDLSWVDASTNETYFLLERCTGVGCSDFARLDSLGDGSTTYQDLTVVLGNVYRYQVAAYNNSGTSGYDGPAEASTLLPATPTDLTAIVVNSGRIDLGWTDASDNEDGFRVERCSGIGCSNFVELTTLPDGTQAYSVTGLAPNTFYSFRIRAFNAAGPSPYTPTADANTFLPAAPSALTAVTVLADRVDLTWNDNSNNEASFELQRCTGVGCSDFATLVSLGVDVETYSDLTTVIGQTYGYRVRSVNGVGASGFSTTTATTANVPADPSALTAEATSETSIQLNWTDNASDEIRFRIERCVGAGCSAFVAHDSVGADITSYDDTGIASGESFSYRVRAVNVGSSGASNAATATTILPAAPTGLTATGVASDRADLAWTDNADNEYGYEIERCTGAGCSDFTNLTTVGPDVTSYADVTLAAGTTYTYRVRAYNGAGTSAFSNESAATSNVPDIPTGLVATTISNSQIDLAWVDVATTETGYEIERCAGVGCTDFAQIQAIAADATAYSDAGLPAGTIFRYRVRAVNASGGSGYSNISTSGTNVPADPTNLVATTISDSQIDLSWTDNADNELQYVVERCTGAGCSGHLPIATLPAGTTAYQDFDVSLGNDYVYRVFATNNAGNSGFSNPGDGSTRTPTAPSALVATTASATQINLTWNDNSDNEATFRVRRCAGVACAVTDEVVSLPPGTTSYNDTGLTPNESYTYHVEANNVSGWSGTSNEATATTNIPSDPSGLSATTLSATSIQLDWTDNSDSELRFVIFRCDNAGCGTETYTEVDSVGTDVTSFTDLSLSFGNTYGYRVVARNNAGTSNFAQVAATTLAPADPSSLLAQVVADTEIDLSWTDNADNESGVQVERCEGAGCSDFALLTTTAADATGYSDVSAVLGIVYRYRVRAVNTAGASGYSAEEEEGTVVPNGAPPTLTVNVLSETQAMLTWTDNADNESGYRVERCLGGACVDFAEIATAGANVVEYFVSDLALNNAYRFRIRAYNVIGNASYSNEEYASTSLPGNPTGLTATTVAPGQIDLSWTDNADNEVTYRIERCQGPLCADYAEIATVAANTTAYQNTGVSLNGVYRYRVRALNAIGPSSYSNEDQANTLLPSAPTNLVATAIHGERIDLSWTDSNLEAGYQIEACTGLGCSDFAVIQAATADQTAIQLAVTFGQDYTFRIRAANISGPSAYSNTANASTVLLAPTSVRARTTGRTTIDLSWDDNSGIETAYRVERCTGAGCGAPDFFELLPANTNTYSNAALAANGTFYTYRVRAITIGGNTLSTAGSAAMTPVEVAAPMNAFVSSDSSGSERHWVVNVPAGARQLVLKQNTGSGDPDVYLRYNAVPVAYDLAGAVSSNSSPTGSGSTYCVPYTGSTPEYCVINDPTPGDWFIMSQGFSSYTDLQVEVSIPGDVVVLNDLNTFFSYTGSSFPMTDQFARNLVQHTPGVGPRTSQTQVYIDWGRASFYGNLGNPGMKNVFASVGYSTFDIASVAGNLHTLVPATAKVLILHMPSTAFTAEEVTFLRNFVREGGRVVHVGEAPSFMASGGPTLNQVLASFGSSSTYDMVASDPGGAMPGQPDPLSGGLSIQGGSVGLLNLGPNDKALALGTATFRPVIALIRPTWMW